MCQKVESNYSFNNNWNQAELRLSLLERLSDKTTKDLLTHALNLNNAAQCWELGAGSGSIAQWLCNHTRINTKILATDIDTSLLKSLNHPKLTVLNQNVLNDLPRECFDLIHARSILIHIPTRHQLLSSLSQKLNDRGTILIEEPSFSSFRIRTGSTSQSNLFADLTLVIKKYQENVGMMNHSFGQRLGSLLRKEGLTIIKEQKTDKIIYGGTLEAHFFFLTYLQIKNRVLEHVKLKETVYNQFLDLFHNPDFSFYSYTMFSVLAQRIQQTADLPPG